MKKSMRMVVAAVSTVAVAAGALGVAVGGCSSSGTNGGGGGGGGGTGTGSGIGPGSSGSGSGVASACSSADDILQVVFAPMYSAVIPGDTNVTFYVPAIVAGVAAGVKVSWGASSDAVMLSSDPSTGGVLIQMLPTGSGGQVTITASAGGSCGTSTLNITESTAAAWEAGAARYHDGVPIPSNPRAVFDPDAGPGSLRIACVNCHAPNGEDAGMGFGFNDVAHTPEQTGGFSDEVLLAIVQGGNVPGWSGDPDAATLPGLSPGQTSADAGYFDPTIISFAEWHRFHQWNLTSTEQTGIITYLRSLAPSAQSGTANFGGFGGGHPPPDGGYKFPDGGMHHHHDGGGGPPPGSGSGTGS